MAFFCIIYTKVWNQNTKGAHPERNSWIRPGPQLELKPLPNGFKYAYLGPSETFPVVISAALNEEQEGKLLCVLRDHKLALG